ncbi:MAG: SAM-dependent methyltransferase [Flavobacteriales bacterium]|nr:SAM-dependent methyltransferase [Flavobacteriales bacterium]
MSKVHKADEDLKNIFVVPVNIKNKNKLSFTYRYQTKDQVKNYDIEQALEYLHELIGRSFLQAQLKTTSESHQLLISKKGKSTLISTKSDSNTPSKAHNKEKNHLIKSENNKYLQMLGVCDNNGRVTDKQQDKYKQINRYVELMSSWLTKLDPSKTQHIVDMGSGKGYLTFALYDYLTNSLKQNIKMIGVELRPELVSLCMEISEACGFNGLEFVSKDINDFKSDEVDVLIALHACDTATDSAIFKGIRSNANLIVCAPCCHKQVRRDMKERSKFNSITKHGIFKERQAEMLTDTLRTLIMEKEGYKTKAFEFISNEHTRKNIMLVGKKTNDKVDKTTINKEIDFLKKSFEIERQELEDLLSQS